MPLPNFINFEPFNQLRRKMHTERMGNFHFEPEFPEDLRQIGVAGKALKKGGTVKSGKAAKASPAKGNSRGKP